MMNPLAESQLLESRRQFLRHAGVGIGTAALSSLLCREAQTKSLAAAPQMLAGLPHHQPTAKRVIYLFQSGAPSQIETFDYKPQLKARQKEELPASVRMGQRLTGMTSGQKSFPVANPLVNWARHGKCDRWVSDLLPYTAKVADELCVVKSMFTEHINHDPAITFVQTGHQQPGRPSLGAWASYGLGSENQDLPAFVVLISRNLNPASQPIYSRLWGSGFLPSSHQGVKLRSAGDPVLYLTDPANGSRESTRRMLDRLAELNSLQYEKVGDPEINTRIASYEMAFRMQASVPDLTDLSNEPQSTFELYGEDARKPGTFAFNCLMARRLAERDVRFIQLYCRDWDHHDNLPNGHKYMAKETDQGCAALVADLKQRGLLDDTLVIWGGEFGRTIYSQGQLTADNYGRDHHPRCFTMWLAGGGVKGGMTYGETDDYSYNITENPVHVHDLNATILHCLGIDHERLTFRFQGRDFRLTDVHGTVQRKILV
jgi:hypothetical protein